MAETTNINELPQIELNIKNIKVKNSNNTYFSHKNDHQVVASEIKFNSDISEFKTINDQKFITEQGLMLLDSRLGKIKIMNNNQDNDAILIQNNNSNAGISINSGNAGFVMNSTGDINFGSNGSNIKLGDDNTLNLDIDINEMLNISSNETNIITTDDILMKSTTGEVILDSGLSNDGVSSLRANENGDILINTNITEDNYQTEIHVDSENKINSGKNGLLIVSKNSNITPEIRTVYSGINGDRQVINTMGTYSETSTNSQFRKYSGIYYDNKLIPIEGLDFDESDIGRKIVFQQSGNTTIITGITNVIFPVDNTYLTSNIIVSGNYTGLKQKNYKIEIDGIKDISTGKLCDTFRWSNNSGINYNNTFIPLTEAIFPSEYLLEDGIKIQFDESYGNSIGEFGSFIVRIGSTVEDNKLVNGETESEKILNALSNTEVFITTNPFNAFFGTETNNDVILKTSDQERFRITADGSIGASKDKIDARLHLSSDINKVSQVNDNIITTGENIIGNQINPSSTELNTGGFIITYESQESKTVYYDIYADYFTANGEKVGNSISFKVNKNILYNQSHPHIAKSGISNSDNCMIVWSSQDPDNVNLYQIRGALIKNGNMFINEENDLFLSFVNSNITLTPRVVGLKNGDYVITYSSLADNTDDDTDNPIYNIKYVITDSNGNIKKVESSVSNNNNSLNQTYPFICSLNKNNTQHYSEGFVIAYMKEVFSNDNRYQIVYKIFSINGEISTQEHQITTTGDRGEVGEINTDFNLSDGRCFLMSLPRSESLINDGFYIAYQNNFSASVPFTTNPTRTIIGLSSNASGDISSSVINTITGIHTIILNSVNGDFLKGELLSGISDIQGQSGFFLEKVFSVSNIVNNGVKVSTIILSKDPKNIILARYSLNDIDNNNPNNLIFRKIMNTTILVNDRLLQDLTAENTTPMNFIRANNIFYAYRGMAILSHNNLDKGIIGWQTGDEPNIYYQQFNLSDGSLIENEQLIAENNLGYRQTDPYIAKLQTTQGNLLGYSISFTGSSLEQSSTGIFQELIGPSSYLFHMNNKTTEFVLDNNGRMGIGTKHPSSSLHIKSIPKLNNNYVDQVNMIMQTSSNNINNLDDLHKISFTDIDNTELARIKVKYSNGYQDMNPDADNLIAYFKLDEKAGSLITVDNGLYNLQVNTDSQLIATSLGASALLNGFNVNKCWKSGLINNGLEFNGISSYLSIPKDNGNSSYINSIDELHAGNFTISFWLKIDKNIFVNTVMDLLSFGNVELTEGINEGSGFMKLSLIDNNSDKKLRPRISGLYTINNSSELSLLNLNSSNSKPLNDGLWHNLIFNHTKTEISTNVFKSRMVIYQDSIEIINSDTLFNNDDNYVLGSIEEIATDLTVYIGSGVNGDNNYYRGMMDELRFYRSSLSLVEISRIYKYGSSLRTQLQIQTLGNNTTYSDTEPGLVIDDTGAIVGGSFKNDIARQLSGIIKITVLNPNMIIGVSNTKFISEIQVGDNLFLDKTPDGNDIGSDFAGNFYQVEEIYSNTSLKLNRNVDNIDSDSYFNHITLRPSILVAYDDTEKIKMNIDFNGDVVIGDGKNSEDITKLEIRGNNLNRSQKTGLMLSNTNIDVNNFYLSGARSNHIIYKSQNGINSSVVMGSLEIAHSNTNIEDDKSVFNIKLNSGSDNNLSELKTVASFTGNGKVNFGNNVLENEILNDIQFNGKIEEDVKEDLRIAFLSNKAANGIFSESTHLNFFGGQSLNRNDNENDNSALVKIKASNNKPILSQDITTSVNGRLDFLINKQINSSISGPKTRFCITSQGYNGIHIINPSAPLDVAPEFKEDLIKINPITEINNITKEITFTDNDPATAPLFSNDDNNYLRCGRLVVNDGIELNTYIINSNINNSIFNGDSKLYLNNSEILESNLLIGKSYTLHYAGLKVNKYGLVGIGDSRFNDNSKSHHLSISGNTCIKGELHLTHNIDAINPNDISKVAFKVNNNNELLIKDNSTSGFVKIFGGSTSSAINSYSNNTILTYDNSTVLINNLTNAQINITIPNTSSDYIGRIFNLKKINTLGNVKIVCNDNTTIDGFQEQFLEHINSGITIQTDGIKWYVINSIIVPDDIRNILE